MLIKNKNLCHLFQFINILIYESKRRRHNMVFSSFEFILVFLPIFYILYAITPKTAKNLCLFIASLIFYAIGVLENPFYLPLFVISLVINFFIGNAVENIKRQSKLFLIIGIVFNISLLFVFKYSSFFAEIILHREVKSFVLPIGISFYTFQCISYIVDVYKGRKAEKSFINLGAYISMFPQLIAGPIVRYGDIAEQIKDRKTTKSDIWNGICLFVFGLGFKVLLANRLGSLWSDINAVGYDAITTISAWLGIIAFSFQIYFDFWGYSLMAIGLGKTMGFNLPKNFNYPYTSLTMTDFWRRWHITLGTWFREYVYIPLGGNRKGKIRTYINMFIVWSFTGFWHGASWNFVLWGILLFILIAIEKAGLGKVLTKYKFIGRIYMFAAIIVSWLLFATEDMSAFVMYIKSLIGLGGEYAFAGDYIKHITSYGIFLIIGALLSTTLPKIIYERIKDKKIAVIPVLTAIVLLSLYCMYKGMNDPFLYFKF